MVFLMLKDQIGERAFHKGVQLLWQRKQFQVASWADLESAFSEAADRRPLSSFFQQWVNLRGAPRLKFTQASYGDGALRLHLEQEGRFQLSLPLRLRGPLGFRDERIGLTAEAAQDFSLPLPKQPKTVELDPDYRLWRHLDVNSLPPILRELWIAPGIRFRVMSDRAEFRSAAAALARNLIEGRLLTLDERGPMLVITDTLNTAALSEQQMQAPETLPKEGTSRVWSGRDEQGQAWAVIEAKDVAALEALSGPLPHHGRQSWLSFDGAKVVEKGVWPVPAESLEIESSQ
jgi:hypothetical protein